MSCVGCRKRQTLDKVIELARRMVELENKTYVIIKKGNGYDFQELEYATKSRSKIIKILPHN